MSGRSSRSKRGRTDPSPGGNKEYEKDIRSRPPGFDPEEQPMPVLLNPFEVPWIGATSINLNEPTENDNLNQPNDNDNTEQIISHASQFEQIVKKVKDDYNLFFTNMEKLKDKNNSFSILSSKYGVLEEEAKVLCEERASLLQKVKELENQLKEVKELLPSKELDIKLLELELELNHAKSVTIVARRALDGKELEIVKKDNEILRLKALCRENLRLSNCT